MTGWRDALAGEFMALAPAGGFKVILADPPWEFETRSQKGQGKSPSRHYDTLTVEHVMEMPVGMLAAPNCALFLWVTWPIMPDWTRVIQAWGFSYAGLAWEWRKFNPETGRYAFGPGYGTRKNLEPCLLARRGNPRLRRKLPADLFGLGAPVEGARGVRDWMEWWPEAEIRAPRREHSRKPDEQYERVETLFNGPYVELFARSRRPGWAAWGNQLNRFGGT